MLRAHSEHIQVTFMSQSQRSCVRFLVCICTRKQKQNSEHSQSTFAAKLYVVVGVLLHAQTKTTKFRAHAEHSQSTFAAKLWVVVVFLRTLKHKTQRLEHIHSTFRTHSGHIHSKVVCGSWCAFAHETKTQNSEHIQSTCATKLYVVAGVLLHTF